MFVDVQASSQFIDVFMARRILASHFCDCAYWNGTWWCQLPVIYPLSLSAPPFMLYMYVACHALFAIH